MGIATEEIPGFLFFDHVAVSVKLAMGSKEVHREDVLGRDQVCEVLLRLGDGPSLI